MHELREGAIAPNPFDQFARWFADASAAGIPDPNAMTVATVSPEGLPSARMVLLKDFDESGFVFYTNYNSRKGRELASNPYASLVFYWPLLHRQVRVEGRIEPVSAEESDRYFASRPLGSQISATISPQSSVISSREELEAKFAEAEAAAAGQPSRRPAHWGGVRVVPESIEFWQGRPNRLHDRLRYHRADGEWIVERLAP